MPWSDSLSAHVTAGEIARNFGRWQDKALQSPITVTHHGRPRVVIVAADAFAALNSVGSTGASDASSAAPARLLDNLAQGFAALDADLNIVAVNHRFETLCDRTAAQLMGSSWEDSFSDQHPILVEQLRRVLRTGEASELDMASVRFPGRHYFVRMFPYNEGIAVLVHNQTEEMELRTSAREAIALSRALSVTSSTGVAVLNSRGVFTRVDAGFTALTGFSAADLALARLIDIVSPSDRHATREAIERSLQQVAPLTFFSTVLIKRLTQQSYEISVAPIEHGGATDGLVAVFRRA